MPPQTFAGPRPPIPERFRCVTTPAGPEGVLVRVRGELDILTTPVLGRTLDASWRSRDAIVLDLREVSFLDCTGVGVIVDASARAREAARRLTVVAPADGAGRILALTGALEELDTVSAP